MGESEEDDEEEEEEEQEEEGEEEEEDRAPRCTTVVRDAGDVPLVVNHKQCCAIISLLRVRKLLLVRVRGAPGTRPTRAKGLLLCAEFDHNDGTTPHHLRRLHRHRHLKWHPKSELAPALLVYCSLS